MRDVIINLQKSNTWKIQLTIATNFISSEDVDEERVMHSKSDNAKFMTNDDTNDLVDELFKLLLSRYQFGLETSIRGSNFIFYSVQVLYYKCDKVSFKHGGSNIESLNWIKNKNATINPRNGDDVFQYVATVTWNHEEIKRDPQRIWKIKLFINKYNKDGIKYPLNINDWKTFEKKILHLSLMFDILNKWKSVQLIFQTLTWIVRSN